MEYLFSDIQYIITYIYCVTDVDEHSSSQRPKGVIG